MHLNSVDLARFRPGPALPQRPRRALAFAKNAGHVEAIRQACRRRGIALDVIGTAVGRVLGAPEAALPDYDLVFCSALSALEAMACGRALIVCDGRGLAGLVTTASFDTWRPLNFGLRTLTRPPTAEAVAAEIDAYDAAEAAAVCARVRAEAGLEAALARLVALYRTLLAEAAAAAPDEAARALATARYLEEWTPRSDFRWPWTIERDRLLRRIDRLERSRPFVRLFRRLRPRN